MLRLPFRERLPDLVEDVLREFRHHESRYAGVRVRAVQCRVAEEWLVVSWVAQAYRIGDQPPREEDREYRRTRFAERWVQPAEFEQFVRVARTADVIAGLASVRGAVTADSTWSVERAPGGGARYQRSGARWEMACAGMLGDAIGSESDVSFARPVLVSPIAAAGEWLEHVAWHGRRDVRLGHGFIELPETRSVMTTLTRKSPTVVRVAIDRGEGYAQRLVLRGVARSRRDEATVHVALGGAGGAHEFTIPEGSETLGLCLVAEDDTLLDVYEEYPHRCDVRGPVLRAQVLSDPEATDLREVIDAGENDRVEFKELVPPAGGKGGGDSKRAEYLETVTAFANTAGGQVIVGVRQDGTVAGVGGPVPDDPVARAKCLTFADSVARELEDLARTKIAPAPSVRARVLTLNERAIVVVQVDELDVKPCEAYETRDIRVRRGATNRHPSRAEYEALFAREGRTSYY
ncbi:MAG: ATP-binding protein [Planctomycetes bacterium]|nr:ATP-binding protein [Planctomycetota bacterium]